MKNLKINILLPFGAVLPATLTVQQPNIVFIFTDNLGYTDPGCCVNMPDYSPALFDIF